VETKDVPEIKSIIMIDASLRALEIALLPRIFRLRYLAMSSHSNGTITMDTLFHLEKEAQESNPWPCGN
jgi:hypothetical protein